MQPLVPSEKLDETTIEFWYRSFEDDSSLRLILESAQFQRLNNVSFLGAIDYIAPTKRFLKKPRSRAVHSIHVAALANFIASKRNYEPDLKRHLIAAALLHDVGHAPLSHSVEPFFKRNLGLGHHEMGERTLRGIAPGSQIFSDRLRARFDIGFISNLIDGKANSEEGGDLFNSKINIDTIDGIIRTYNYLSDDNAALNRISVAQASFLENDDYRFKVLDNFWKLKDFVYKNLINNKVGIIADKLSQNYFCQFNISLDEKSLQETDATWKRKHKNLFNELKYINGNSQLKKYFINTDLKYTKRNYLIENRELNEKRYYVKKESSIYTFKNQEHGIECFTECRGFKNYNMELDL